MFDNQDFRVKEGESEVYLEKVPSSLTTFEYKKIFKKENDLIESKIIDYSVENGQYYDETKNNLSHNITANQQHQQNIEQSLIGNSNYLGIDVPYSTVSKNRHSQSRKKSDITNSVMSSGSDFDEETIGKSIKQRKTSIQKYNGKNSQGKGSMAFPSIVHRASAVQRVIGLKKRPTFSEVKINAPGATEDQLKSTKKQQRRGNIVLIDQRQLVWSKNWVQIIYYIGKMKKLMKQTILFFRPELLTKWQLNTISDLSCDFSEMYSQHQNADYVKQYSYQQYERFLSFKTYKMIKKFLLRYFSLLIHFYHRLNFFIHKFQMELFEFLPIFNSLQKFYIFWELIIFICAITNIFYISLEIAFSLERNQFFRIHFEYICVLVFCMDIFIRSNTQYYEQGTKIEIHRLILKNYIKNRLVFDILSIISLNQTYFQSRYVGLLFFLRIFYSTRIIDIFREQFLLRIHISGIISLVLLLTQALYFCHIFSCSFYALGKYQMEYNEGWLVHYGLANGSNYYFSVVTMTTIGYGDISAQSNAEKGFMIFFMLVSCGIFGYTINSIGNILYDFKLKRDQFLFQLAQINKYFKFYNTDISLQSRARKYIEYTYSDNIEDSNISIDSLNSLSSYLQNEIRNDAYKKAICKNKIMKQYFSEQFIEALASKMKEVVLSPDQVVIEEGETKEPAIYFVNNGTLNIFSARDGVENQTHIKKLAIGDVFGIEEFFLERYYTPFSVKSVGVSSLLLFNLTDFLELLKKHPDQVEMFCFLKDSLQFNKDFSKLQLSCFSCAQYNHSVNNCPYLFYGTNPQRIIRNYLNDIDKFILTFKRNEQRIHFNSRLNNEEVKNTADQFFLDNQDDLSYISYTNDSDEDDEEDDEVNVQGDEIIDKDKLRANFNQNSSQSHPIEDNTLIVVKEDKATPNVDPSVGSIYDQDKESFIPPRKVSIENYVYSYQNIPKSISQLPEMNNGILKLPQQDNGQSLFSPMNDQNNLLVSVDQGERRKQRSYTSINTRQYLYEQDSRVVNPSSILVNPSNLNQSNLQVKFSATNLPPQKSVVFTPRKQSLDPVQAQEIMIKQMNKSKMMIKQISRESNKDDIRDRKSTKNLDQKNGQSEIDFKSILAGGTNHSNLKPNLIELLQKQSISLEYKDLAQLFTNFHPNPQTQSRNQRDGESKRIGFDADRQPSSNKRQLPLDGESRLHRMKSRKDLLFDVELDKIQSYTIYFPKYNIDVIIQKMQKQDMNFNLKHFLNNTIKKFQTQKII